MPLALDLRDPSWDGAEVAPAVRVNDWEAEAPFRYLRFREPPYAEEQLGALAERIKPLLAAGIQVFAYFQHEDAPRRSGIRKKPARAHSPLIRGYNPSCYLERVRRCPAPLLPFVINR